MGSCIEQLTTPRHDSASLHVQTTLSPVKEAFTATARWRPRSACDPPVPYLTSTPTAPLRDKSQARVLSAFSVNLLS